MKQKILIAALIAALGAASANIAVAEKPNDGKAESVLRAAGGVAGAAAGGAAGAARGGNAGAAAGAAAGQKAGEELGEKAGQYLDERAEENRQTGRGGPDDPRFNPLRLFDR